MCVIIVGISNLSGRKNVAFKNGFAFDAEEKFNVQYECKIHLHVTLLWMSRIIETDTLRAKIIILSKKIFLF